MLQGRLFSYGDAARYRLGVNHRQIPVNYPRGARLVNTYHRDGAMRVDANQGGVPGVEPNNRQRAVICPRAESPRVPSCLSQWCTGRCRPQPRHP